MCIYITTECWREHSSFLFIIPLKKNPFFEQTRKNETKLRKTEKNMEKENNTDESDFSENEIPDLNSLKPFEFERKTKTGDFNNS